MATIALTKDIHDETVYGPGFEVLDAGPDLVPPRVAAGAALGRVRSDHPVERARGAVLTVAGHDHLVAAAALGAGGIGSLCDSMGTAEALVAAVSAPPPPQIVAGLVSRGLSVYPHVVDSTTCLLGALRTGLVLGRVRADHPVERARGAVLTVAGHDHLVAAAALGAGGIGSLCDSMGTAEALVAAVVAPPAPRVVAGLVSRGLSVYPHVVDSTTCLLGALRTGLVLGRALDILGATTIEQRLAFDAGGRPGVEPVDVTVEGLDMADDHVTVGWPEGTDPLAAWAGVLARTREVVASEVVAMRAVGVPVDDVVVTGGWAQLPSVRASRVGIGARTHHVRMEEPGTTGAALFARWAATRHPAGSDPTTHEAPHAEWFTDPSI